jgi:glutathione S-transferase
MALAHKDLPVETIPWRFTEKQAIAASGQSRVPVLVDGDKWISDSWAIANYLEDHYPDRPSLFGGGAGRSLTFFYSNVADALVVSIFPLIALDIHEHLDDRDRGYFRESREDRVGTTLEKFAADRETRVAVIRQNFAALRMTLKAQPFFGGQRPLYADYAIFGPFQWARCTSPFAVLASDDPIRLWRERMLDLFDGLARSSPGYDA